MPLPPRVTTADGDLVRVQSEDRAAAGALLTHGFRAEASGFGYVRTVPNEVEKAALLARLRDAGVCFERGREWSPAEVFEYLRDRGLIAGSFRSLAWRGPGEWVARDE